MTPDVIGYTGFDWNVGDYSQVFIQRAQRLARMRTGDPVKDAQTVNELKAYYAENPADFINDWGMTVDSRNLGTGKPIIMPFVLFGKQRDFITWTHERLKSKEDGISEKSRDMGVSWLCVAFGCWMWLFHPSSVVGFGSRIEDAVDKPNNPHSLFWKARQFIDLLPVEFKPPTFSPKHHTPFMRIINPDNGASIIGEAGKNIGRGSRATIYFIDEAAHLEQAEENDAALSQSSNCKIWVSTPCGNGNLFFRKRFSGRLPVFTFRWQEDPRKGEDWYAKQKAILDPVILAQEVDIDYAASVSNALISADLVAESQETPPASVQAVGGWIIGVDAAHEGNDLSVIHARRGRFNMPQREFAKMDGPDLARAVEDYCDELAADAQAPIAGIVIELDGPGVSCYDQLKRGPYGDCVYGIHTGKKLRDNKHYNLRALLWARALDYFKQPPTTMARCPNLKSQIGAMLYSYKDGMLLIQDKKQFKKQFGRSPDNADAFVLTFYDVRPRLSAGGRNPVRVNLSHANRKRPRR